MALAGNLVIAEVNQIVHVGQLDPNDVMTPATLVDYLIKA